MTFHTPEGWADRCTMRDDTLPHQIRLSYSGTKLVVSCTCRHLAAPIGEIATAGEALRMWRAHQDELAPAFNEAMGLS